LSLVDTLVSTRTVPVAARLLSLLLLAIAALTHASATHNPNALTPSLKCSACEVTARELYNAYVNRSRHDKFYGTGVEYEEVTQAACDAASDSKYTLRQENFGAHLKVFADATKRFDAQSTEPADIFNAQDRARYGGAVSRLRPTCQEILARCEAIVARAIRHRESSEARVRFALCHRLPTKTADEEDEKVGYSLTLPEWPPQQPKDTSEAPPSVGESPSAAAAAAPSPSSPFANPLDDPALHRGCLKLCNSETLKPYRDVESRRRRRWKQRRGLKEKVEARLRAEVQHQHHQAAAAAAAAAANGDDDASSIRGGDVDMEGANDL
jgi:hypothetical protein